MNICGIPKKERLLVARLRDFVENEQKYSVALIPGIHKVGKTTILNQIEAHYIQQGLNVLKFSLNITHDCCEVIEDIAEKEPGLLLLDDISYLDYYEMFSEALSNMTSGENYKKFKVIMTGSSAHIIKLIGKKLDGRAKLFRLPPLTFVEYLYFTDRISSYSEYNSVTNADFSDYLQLKGLEEKAEGLAITFDEDYFNAFYDEVAISNEKSYLVYSLINLNENDLLNMINLLTYKLSEVYAWEKLTLSNTIIEDSVKAVPGINESDIGRILHFLLWSGFANIEYALIDADTPVIDVGSVLNMLKNVKNRKELDNLFEQVSICMNSPLYYTRIGNEIMRRMKVSDEKLYKDIVYGKMLEIYIRGALAVWSKTKGPWPKGEGFKGLKPLDHRDWKSQFEVETSRNYLTCGHSASKLTL